MHQSILIPIDINEESSWKNVLKVVSTYFTDSTKTIHLATVVPREEALGVLSQFIPKGFEQKQLDFAKSKLEALSAQLEISPDQCKHHVSSGNTYVEVLKLAETCKADLIVLASHRPELKDYLLGPNAARILRHSNCSVFVVRN